MNIWVRLHERILRKLRGILNLYHNKEDTKVQVQLRQLTTAYQKNNFLSTGAIYDAEKINPARCPAGLL
jgi:hypothetical protein